MKVFIIKEKRNDSSEDASLGCLVYYEEKKEFQIRIYEKTEYWMCPVFLSSFIKKGEYVLDARWSRVWVQQRILSWERQNLQAILTENQMEEYDEYELLLRTQGKCGQDDCYLELQN